MAGDHLGTHQHSDHRHSDDDPEQILGQQTGQFHGASVAETEQQTENEQQMIDTKQNVLNAQT